jgi:hypothetical protein
MRVLLLSLVLATLCGCGSLPTPGVSLSDARFADGPVIIQRGEHFYLRYRRALEAGRFSHGNPILVAKKTKDAGYYYFSTPISHMEWGNLVERPLAYDELEDLAQLGKVYWLDPDGTKHPLQIRPDA